MIVSVLIPHSHHHSTWASDFLAMVLPKLERFCACKHKLHAELFQTY